MPRPSLEALHLAQSYRLALHDAPPRGLAGERLGRGTGASLEFQDRRTYAAGDDVRHLDWRAFARTDQLLVRQYREEVLPRVEILLDVSRSMAVEEVKAQCAVDLVAILATAARAGGFQAVIALAGEQPEIVDIHHFEREGAGFEGRSPWSASLSASLSCLRTGSMRVLVSDFLFPHEAGQLVRPLRVGVGGFALVQVLGRADREPPMGEALRLADAETDGVLDLVLDRRSCERYRERLSRLSDGLEAECRRGGGSFVAVDAGSELERVCRDRLVPAGVLAVG
jgi:hypothetical protein